jgi:hypothetical protein
MPCLDPLARFTLRGRLPQTLSSILLHDVNCNAPSDRDNATQAAAFMSMRAHTRTSDDLREQAHIHE